MRVQLDDMKRKILCIHQSAELYGSDRSFLSAILALKKSNVTDIVLPFSGELSSILDESGAQVTYFKDGILRKNDVKKPIIFCCQTLRGVFFYFKKFKDYEIIYINTIVMLSAILASAGYRFSSKKIICHIREIPSRKQMFFFKALFRISGVELAFNSEATKKAFNLPGTVIYNGVDDIGDYTTPRRNELRNTSKVKLLLVGRINTWKGHELLIDAIINNYLRIGENSVELDIVGSPFEGYEYLEDKLKKKVEKYKLSNDIRFIPFTKHPEQYFVSTDYVVVPSTKPEPFGRVAAEAFSAGKPVIAANHGGLAEIVTNMQDGYLFEPNDENELAKILDDITKTSKEEYMRMSECARNTYTSKFSLEIYQEKINSLVSGNS